jgi:UDP-glucose 4-epimerase
MAERILVTGGAGCIGSELAERLLRSGHQVTVVDNLSSGKREHIEQLLPNRNFRFVVGDLLDMDLVCSVTAGQDLVFHFAANPDVKFAPGDPTDKDLRQNTLCTYNLLEAMRRHRVRRLAFSSTSAVYGPSERQPIPEDTPARPISLYGATKLSCEAMVGAFQNLFGMDCWIFRFANIVGPRTRKTGRTVVGDFIEKLRRNASSLEILGDGRQAKSYLLSRECIEAMLFVMEGAPRGLQIFNLGSSDSLSVRRIADMIVEAMGLENVQYNFTGGEGGWPGDVPRFRLDVSKLTQLGWQAAHTSEQAVWESINMMLAEPVCRS